MPPDTGGPASGFGPAMQVFESFDTVACCHGRHRNAELELLQGDHKLTNNASVLGTSVKAS